jgi:hypothetical protein
MLLSVVISLIIIGVYVIINIIGEGPNLKDFIYFILIVFGVFLGSIAETTNKNLKTILNLK